MKKEMFCFLVLLLFISCGSQGISLGNGFLGNGKSGGLWLMLSADKAYKSTNAENWYEVKPSNISNTTGNFVGLAYGKENTKSNNYHWLALTRNDGHLFSSTDDGATWKRKGRVTYSDGTVVTGSFEDLATDGKGNWIALASNRIHKYGFSNPNKWTDSEFPTGGTQGKGIAYGNGLWALLTSQNNTDGHIDKSNIVNGTAWEPKNNNNSWGSVGGGLGDVNSIVYGKNIWTVVTSGGMLWFFKKGLKLNEAFINNNRTNRTVIFIDIAYGNGKWVAVRSASAPPIIFSTTLVTNPNTVTYEPKTPTGIPTTPTPTPRFTTVAFRP